MHAISAALRIIVSTWGVYTQDQRWPKRVLAFATYDILLVALNLTLWAWVLLCGLFW